MKRLLYILFSGLFAASCVYTYDAKLSIDPDPVIVIDGNIIVGEKAQLSVGYMMSLDYKYPDGKRTVSSLSWWVEDENGTRYMGDDEGKADLSAAPLDHSYRMVVQADGNTYVSGFSKPLEPPVIDDISFDVDESGANINTYLSMSGGTGYAAIQMQEIWEFHTDFEQEYDCTFVTGAVGPGTVAPTETHPSYTYLYQSLAELGKTPNYYCWNKTNSNLERVMDFGLSGGPAKNYLLSQFSRRSSKICRNYYLKIRVRSLSQEEYRYFSNLTVDEAKMVSLFSPNPGELAGNVINLNNPKEKVLGYVSSSRYSSAETYLDNRFHIVTPEPDEDTFLYLEKEQLWDYYYREVNPYRPVRWVPTEGFGMKMGWVHIRCVDCTVMGGTLTKPDFDF